VKGVESESTVSLYEKEKTEIFNGLRDRAEILTTAFNKMKNVSCSEI